MKVTFLGAEVPLTKSFISVNGELQKIGHPQIVKYTSYEFQFSTIEDLFPLIKEQASKNHCLLKGNLVRQLVSESRAGATDPNAPTSLVCLDFDGVKNLDSYETFLHQVGLGNISYIIQYSASMGIVDKGFSAHIFMVLEKETAPAILKQWLMNINFTNPLLKANLMLSRTNNTLRWPLDITTCQNDKLIYIAPPILGNGVVDNFKGERIALVKKDKPAITLPDVIVSPEANKQASEKIINELREKAGLPARKNTQFKVQGLVEYMQNPDKAVVSGTKTDRGFTYLNLNGGDSWGYYHPENNPEFIFNFKGEPVYKTSELLPDYWSEVREKLNTPHLGTDGKLYLAFRDFRTSAYYNGIWDPKTESLEMAQARSAEQLRHFLKQYGQPVGDFVPDWHVVFNPTSDIVVDIDTKTINTFRPSVYMRLPPRKVTEVPPTIRKVMYHMLGNDEESMERLLNSLAVIWQYRQRTNTSWIWHGTQGTGKGLFVDKILRPLFGHSYVVSKRMEELDSQFNGYIEHALILFIDEAQLSNFDRADVIDANIKNYIVEPKISIRRMYTMPYEVDNYTTIIFASNKHDPVNVPPEDRRFNVASFQPNRLEITQEEVRKLEDELVDFAMYLHTRTADIQLARTPLNNKAKETLVYVNQSSIDVVCKAILTGDYAFLESQKAQSSAATPSNRDFLAAAYNLLLEEIAKGNKSILLREDVQTILEYTVGGLPVSPQKVTAFLKHHQIMIEPIREGKKTVRGIRVTWNLNTQ